MLLLMLLLMLLVDLALQEVSLLGLELTDHFLEFPLDEVLGLSVHGIDQVNDRILEGARLGARVLQLLQVLWLEFVDQLAGLSNQRPLLLGQLPVEGVAN